MKNNHNGSGHRAISEAAFRLATEQIEAGHLKEEERDSFIRSFIGSFSCSLAVLDGEQVERMWRLATSQARVEAMSGDQAAGLLCTVCTHIHRCDNGKRLAQIDKANTFERTKPEDSVKHDYLVCLEDGEKLKTLKRHLRTKFGMTPDEYRRKWGLPDNYPMVAPSLKDHALNRMRKFAESKKVLN